MANLHVSSTGSTATTGAALIGSGVPSAAGPASEPTTPETMILEIRHRSTGLGYQRQRWPRAVHHIARLGRTEARLIVQDGERPTVWQVVGFLIASILTNP